MYATTIFLLLLLLVGDIGCTTVASVKDLQVYASGPTWIAVRWSSPNTTYPVDVKYTLTYLYPSWYSFSSNYIYNYRPCKCWEGMFCKNLTSLNQNTDYTIHVDAKNYNGNILAKSAPVSFKTGTKYPDPPNATVRSVTSNYVLFMWELPTFLGSLNDRGFWTIVAVDTFLKNKTVFVEVGVDFQLDIHYRDDTCIYYCQVQYPYLPSTVYSVNVTTDSAPSDVVFRRNLITSPVTPRFIGNVTLLPDTVTNGTAVIVLPPAAANITNTSACFVYVTQLAGPHVPPPLPTIYDPQYDWLLNYTTATWIAAEVQLEDKEMNFTIGSDITTDGIFGRNYTNIRLQPGGEYSVSLTALNTQRKLFRSDNITMEETILIPGITTTDVPSSTVMTSSEQQAEGQSSSQIWLIFLLLLVVIPLIGYWLVVRHRRKKFETALKKQLRDSRTTIIDSDSSPVLSMTALQAELDLLDTQRKSLLPPTEIYSRRVPLTALEEYVLSALSSGELKRQHQLFPQGCVMPCEYGQLPPNKPKNRYGNLIAYDDTRVKLEKLPGDPYSDYINANYIDGYACPKAYIATQGPKKNTLADFWRMVWLEKVHIICMLSRIWEDGRVKCDQYWPELSKQVTHGDVTVTTIANQVFADFTIRRLSVTCKGAKRDVQHLHFMSWPDHGVPLYAQSVSLYLKRLLTVPKGEGPILVHCSAGVGRTGTIILADINLRMADAESAVDILHYLQRIRNQRPNLVDNIEQYRLVHMVLMECLVEENTAISCEGDFRARVESLQKQRELEKQYQVLEKRCARDQTLVEYLEIGPGGLTSQKKRKSVTLNAVSVSGFRIKSQFVTCHLPTTESVADFWQLVLLKKVSVILYLNEVDSEEEKYNVWPNKESTLTPIAGMEVNLERVTAGTNLQHTLELTAGETKTTVQLLRLKGWTEDMEIPSSADSLLKLWEDAEHLYKGKGRIMVTCCDGVTACGLFVAMSFLIEKMKLEQVCDVCHTVRTVRQSRKKFITSKAQFDFLHEAAATFLESFQAYANFQ